MKWSFESDNTSSVHPKVFAMMEKVNTGQCSPYGADVWTQHANELIKLQFGADVVAFMVCNGTAANALAIHSLLQPYEGVICHEKAHINQHECGALERLGVKCLIAGHDESARLYPNDLEKFTHHIGFEHAIQPKVVSLSQVTECGTLYSPESIKNIAIKAHQSALLLHIDGARLANAAAALGCRLHEISFDIGVDVVSFGGTKNGLMSADTIIYKNASLARGVEYMRKQNMQLMSKMRYLSAQFIAYLSDDLWLHNARKANEMAAYLAQELNKIDSVEVTNTVQANMVFAILPSPVINTLREEYPFYVLDGVSRLITDYNTEQSHIDGFVNRLKELIV